MVDVSQSKYKIYDQDKILSIKAGEEKIIFDRLMLANSGSFDIKSVIDPENLIDEINEANNEKTISVSVS